MLMRSGFFTRPRPLVEFDCGSQSTSRVLTSAAASEAARLMAVVVLPTPPFWLAIAMTRPMILFSVRCGSEYANASVEINARFLCNRVNVPRETLSTFLDYLATPSVRCVSCGTQHGLGKFEVMWSGFAKWRSVSRGTLFRIRLIMRLLCFIPLMTYQFAFFVFNISTIVYLKGNIVHFTHVYRSTTLFHVTAGWALVGTISS